MTSAIVMPKLGLTMTEGLLASWRVGPGDDVQTGDVLFVVETEKIATEVAAQGPGRIERIVVSAGDVVPVGAVVATWTGEGGADQPLPEAGPAPSTDTPAAGPVDREVAPQGGGRIIATPLARRIAREGGIELSLLSGSGPRGRIKAADVTAALGRRGQVAAPAAPQTVNAAAPTSMPPGGKRRPASAIEKVVARRLTAAKQEIPHFYVLAEADVTRLLSLREELNTAPDAPRISLTHFVVAAVGRALARMPEMNVVWTEDCVEELHATDVGVAVDTPRGLLVPMVRNVAALSIDATARTMSAAVEKTREGRLAAEDLAGGAISVSNVGMFGASHLVPIINPGQSSILGVAAVKPVFRPDASGAPALRQEAGLVLSCDHRVLDGVKAARFLDLVTKLLQQPLALLRA